MGAQIMQKRNVVIQGEYEKKYREIRDKKIENIMTKPHNQSFKPTRNSLCLKFNALWPGSLILSLSFKVQREGIPIFGPRLIEPILEIFP